MFRYYAPWFTRAKAWAQTNDGVDAVVITGDMCNLLMPHGPKAEQCLAIRKWISYLSVPVFFAPGAWDPEGMESWGLANLHLCGEHICNGWRVHVMSAHRICEPIQTTSSQTIIVSHYPPALTRTAVGRDGTHYGRADVREAVEEAGDCRLVLSGHVLDPLAVVDWCEGAMVVQPGIAYFEHEPHEEPALALINTDTRSVMTHDGRRMASHSFAR